MNTSNRDLGSSHMSPASSSWLFEKNKVTQWTPEENKRFEDALALFDKDTPDRWHNVAAMIPGKTVVDVIKQYKELVEDVSDIEAGLIPVPGYSSGGGGGGDNNSFTLEWVANNGYEGLRQLYSPGGKKTRCSDYERKKGVPWTEEEHRQFLLGLKKYGKGDWRNIARNFVTTRTPTQVASHAQKYFIRQLSGGKDKRRSSIHDITTVDLNDTNSPSPDKDTPHSPDKSSFNMRTHQDFDGNSLIQGTYDPDPMNQGTMMGFSPQDSSLMINHLQGTSNSFGLNHMQLGHRGTVFHMHHTQHHQC